MTPSDGGWTGRPAARTTGHGARPAPLRQPASPRRLLGPKPSSCLVLRAPLGAHQWVFAVTLCGLSGGVVASAYSQMVGEPLFQITYSAEARRRAVHGALTGVEAIDTFEFLEAAGREVYQWLLDQLSE